MPLTEINYLQVNIGLSRSIDAEGGVIHFGPATEKAFIGDVKKTLLKFCHRVEVHYGTGGWDDTPERSVHISSYDFIGPLYRDHLEEYVDELQKIAARYGQYSIALITGSEMIRGAI